MKINRINIESGEKFCYKIFIDPNYKFLFEINTIESEEVLIDQFFKSVK